MYRCGTGYDSHRFEEGRKLILGGVEIPSPMGLKGHSDADAVIHAIIDSLLSGCGESDIGTHFPDSDEIYLNADSKVLLAKTRQIIYNKGFKPISISLVIICQNIKLASHILKMREVISDILGTSFEDVGISAKTNEGMGFVGRNEGIAVIANSLLVKNI